MAVVNLPCINDAYIYYLGTDTTQATKNFNTNELRARNNPGNQLGDFQYVLIQFDLSAIPAGSTINSSSVVLTFTQSPSAASLNYVPITSAWSESTVTYNTGPSNTNTGYYSQPAIPLPQSAGNAYSFDITQAAREWMNGTRGNNGVKIGSNGSDAVFASKEHATASWRPYLSVDYTPPNAAPNAPIPQSPGNGWWYNYNNPVVSWNFSDPDAGDFQTAWAVHIIDHNTGAVVRDTGWQSGSATSWTISPGLLNGTYRYRIITQDRYGYTSPWSWEPVFYVDVTPPSIGSPGPQQYTTGTTATVYVDGVTDNMGISRVQVYQVRPDGSYFDIGNATYVGGTRYQINVSGITIEGNWRFDFRAYDNAGNAALGGNYVAAYVYRDTVRATDPNVLASGIKANSVTFNWNAFNDPAPSSGYLRTQLYVRKNGAASSVDIDQNGSVEDFITFTDGRTSYTVNGLLENTSYSFVVTHYDKAGNESNYTWKNVTTNSKPTAQLLSLASNAGYLINQRPKFRISGNDVEGSALNFHLQISNVATFTTTIVDAYAVGGTGWSSASSVGNGVVNTFTPQADIGTGVKYVRVQAYDGQEWGDFGPAIAMNIQAPNWIGAIKATDTTASKRWIDDLRAKVNAIRQARGLPLVVWKDPVIRDWNDPQGATPIKAEHITEIRQALQDVATLFSVTLTWTHSSLAAANRNGQDWLDLRNAAITL